MYCNMVTHSDNGGVFSIPCFHPLSLPRANDPALITHALLMGKTQQKEGEIKNRYTWALQFGFPKIFLFSQASQNIRRHLNCDLGANVSLISQFQMFRLPIRFPVLFIQNYWPMRSQCSCHLSVKLSRSLWQYPLAINPNISNKISLFLSESTKLELLLLNSVNSYLKIFPSYKYRFSWMLFSLPPFS